VVNVGNNGNVSNFRHILFFKRRKDMLFIG